MNSIILKFRDGMTTTAYANVELPSGIAQVLHKGIKTFVFEGTEDDVFYYREASVINL